MQVSGASWLKYNLWHRKAYRLAEQLHDRLRFDLTHQVTSTGYREPGYLWKLKAPFVWGPIGGLHNYPWRFLPEVGFPSALSEALRNVVNSLQLHLSSRARKAARRSSALLVANSTGREEFYRAHRIRPTLMLETGLVAVAESPRAARVDSGSLRILWSGQFVPRKVLSLLLKAIAKLPRDVNCELRVVGGGRLERRWKQLAERLGIASRIQWMGWLPHKQALQQYDWADVFAFTSLRDTSGNVVLEALANGVPIVCLDHQGVRDIVTDRCGVKVPVRNPRQVVDDLSDALASLARDPQLLARMSQGARVRAREYLWSQLGAQMADVYRRVLCLDEAGHETGRPHIARPHKLVAGNGRSLGSAESALGANDAAVRLSRLPDNHVAAAPASPSRRNPVVKSAAWAMRGVSVALHTLFGERHGAEFSILMYHRVTEPVAGVDPPTWNVPPARLKSQLAGLLARGFRPWPLQKLVEATLASRSIPRNVFAVTFDDGYENNVLDAMPILEELRVPATIFLATAFLDSDRAFPFDDWSAAGSPRVPSSSWRPLSSEQCRHLVASGWVELGAHTHTHQRFVGRSEEFKDDLQRSLDVIRQRFGIGQPAFAFPFGLTSPGLVHAAEELGVACALTTRPERVRRGADVFGWGRFGVTENDTAAVLAAKLSGWHTATVTTCQALAAPIMVCAGLPRRPRRAGHPVTASSGMSHTRPRLLES